MSDPPLAPAAPRPPARASATARADATASADATATADFAEFVRIRTPALLRTAFLLTGDQHLAEDLVQSALTRTHRAWRRMSQLEHAEAYTRRAMYHLQVSWWRRRKVPESLAGEPPEPRPGQGDESSRVVTRLALLDALRKLSPAHRAVLVLRYFDDQTEAETAAVLGVSLGTVKSQHSRALVRLRAVAPELANHYFTEES